MKDTRLRHLLAQGAPDLELRCQLRPAGRRRVVRHRFQAWRQRAAPVRRARGTAPTTGVEAAACRRRLAACGGREHLRRHGRGATDRGHRLEQRRGLQRPGGVVAQARGGREHQEPTAAAGDEGVDQVAVGPAREHDLAGHGHPRAVVVGDRARARVAVVTGEADDDQAQRAQLRGDRVADDRDGGPAGADRLAPDFDGRRFRPIGRGGDTASSGRHGRLVRSPE